MSGDLYPLTEDDCRLLYESHGLTEEELEDMKEEMRQQDTGLFMGVIPERPVTLNPAQQQALDALFPEEAES